MKKASENKVRINQYHTKTEVENLYTCKVYDREKGEVKEEVINTGVKKISDVTKLAKFSGMVVLEIMNHEIRKTLYGVPNKIWDENKINLTELKENGGNK